MKKRTETGTKQLSLFDIFEYNKTEENGNSRQNEEPDWPAVLVKDGRTDRNQDGSESLPGNTALGNDGTAPARTLPGDAGSRDAGGLPQQGDGGIPQGRNLFDTGEGDTAQRGSGNAVAGTVQADRPLRPVRAENYHSTEAPRDYNKTFGKAQAYRDNLEVLSLLRQLESEGRPATAEEQRILARYTGFGGLKEILLNPGNDAEWKTVSDISLRSQVKDIYDALEKMDPDGSLGMLPSVKRSIISAFYTPFDIINAIYYAIGKAGFKGGKVLDPSAGIGNFLAAMPVEMAGNSEVTAVEMDTITGKVLRQLFPTAQVHVRGFEKTPLPPAGFDLILSNIPFGDVPIHDSQITALRDNRFLKASDSLHNFFFAKSLLLAKPGAMIALVTSRYTLDSTKGEDLRRLIHDTAEFLGAIRLPDNAFRANAGTDVVTDIIFLKKFAVGQKQAQAHAFLHNRSEPFTDRSGVTGMITYNEYFHEKPGHMLGTPEFGGLYRMDEFNLKGNENGNLNGRIRVLADIMFPEPVLAQTPVDREEHFRKKADNYVSAGAYDSIGNTVVLENGTVGRISADFYVNPDLDIRAIVLGITPAAIRNGEITPAQQRTLMENGLQPEDFTLRVVEPIRVSKEDMPKMRHIENLRRHIKELLFKELNGFGSQELEILREELRRDYNAFTLRFGQLNSRPNARLLDMDSDGYVIKSLEKLDRETRRFQSADILFRRTINPEIEITRTDSVADAVMVSINRHGRLDMNLICELMDTPYDKLMSSQKGDETLIFVEADGAHLSRDEYLSGNVVKKLETARRLAEEDERFLNNVDQLEKVQPKPILASDIYSPLHARWIPRDDILDFLKDLLKTDHVTLAHSRSADEYRVDINDSGAAINALNTERRNAAWVVNHALNGIEPVVTYIVKDGDTEKTVLDAQDTQFAKSLYRNVRGKWDEFKYESTERRERLSAIYNRTFNDTVLRNSDGSGLSFPGLAGFMPKPHQKDAVFRNVQCMGGINDHVVGAGKTLVQVMTAMEMRRLGIAAKPMIIGLKSQIPQLYIAFKQAYPLANVLFPSEKDFARANRSRLLNTIATNDWDCIIISHDQFSAIRQPLDVQEAMVNELREEIIEEIGNTDDKLEKKKLENRLYKYDQKLDTLADARKDNSVLDFEQLGIDFLMVDESQEFKNLEFITSKRNIRGLGNPMGSKKAFNMLIAARTLQKRHGGDKGLLFCSGTPISNSMAEIYLLFKYLAPAKMKEKGFTSFDKFAAVFANDYSELEYYMGRFKEVHRFREFANLPELITMYREIADVRNSFNLTLERPRIEHELRKIEPSPVQLDLIRKLQDFIESKGNDHAEELGLTAGYDPRKKVNPSFALLAINFARKLSLDPRLIGGAYDPGSKITASAENIARIYRETEQFKGTQLVFCDMGTPKSGNIVEDLYNFLEAGETSQSDMKEIFGEDFFDAPRKPDLKTVKAKMSDVLRLGEAEINACVAEASTKQNFNVYDELKNVLVDQYGIPPEQVAFIHSYNTKKAKETLYDQVNKGEVRIVVGSTKKLGTGVNVQERAVTGHHLDISWRPSDVEQRNGRFERQGNFAALNHMGNKVTAYYYATERTLDASMYNTVALKAHFIAQVKTSADPSVRTVKDLEEDVDMGSMAAELSGDPIFKEKAELTKKITELTGLERSFNQKKYNMQDELKKEQRLLEHYVSLKGNMENARPHLDKIPVKDGERIFDGRVRKSSFDKAGQFGMALITEAIQLLRTGTNGASAKLGSLWGFEVMGTVKKDFFDDMVNFTVLSPEGDSIMLPRKMPDTEMAAAMQVKNAIVNIPGEIDRCREQMQKTEENMNGYESALSTQNPYTSELAAKRDRLEVVDGLIVQAQETEREARKNNQAQEAIPERKEMGLPTGITR